SRTRSVREIGRTLASSRRRASSREIVEVNGRIIADFGFRISDCGLRISDDPQSEIPQSAITVS
ncbi:MAG: hypothetical protein DMG04_07350, partial [Acidobacteria bacterium]